MNNPGFETSKGPLPGRTPADGILHRAWQILRRHPQLALFPLLSALTVLGMLAVYTDGFNFSTPVSQWKADSATLWRQAHPLDFAALYFAAMFSATFFNVGFYHEVMRVYGGEQPSLLRGLRFAASRAAPIFTWSLFASTVGLLIQLVSERFGWVARLLGNVTGLAWNVATVFAIPVLIKDGTLDPIKIVRDSSGTVRRTWGELVYGFVRLALLPTLLLVFFVAVLVGVGRHQGVAQGAITITTFAVMFCSMTALGAIRDIYRCALYIYATEGVVPEPFDLPDMDAGWKIKGR